MMPTGLPVATAFRRQDALPPSSSVYAGNLGYGPNPKLAERVRQADVLLVVGARMGEATTDGYALVTPDHPGQVLIHVHPDPEELGRVYRTDLALCADMAEFAESAALWDDSGVIPFDAGAEAHREWLEWSTPQDGGFALDGAPDDDGDPESALYRKAIQIVAESQKASTSYLQRQLRVGYNSAARLIERMEKDGKVGQPDHVGRREVLMDTDGHPL